MAFSRKELEETPHTTYVNLMVTSLTSLSKESSSHRKHKTSWSLGSAEIIRNAFSISATKAYSYLCGVFRDTVGNDLSSGNFY